jgi:hypothetical protein
MVYFYILGKIVTATMDMTVKLGITLPKSIIQNIDQRRGDIPRVSLQ